MKQVFNLNSPEQTSNLGYRLAQLLHPRDLILLDGGLGAGKTTFTKGLATGLGINRPVKSPTFTIVREYQTGKIPLYHMDVYRLEDGGGEELGLEEYINGDGVVVIEWSEFVAAELPDQYLRVKFERNDENGDNYRVAVMEPKGSHYEQLVAELVGE